MKQLSEKGMGSSVATIFHIFVLIETVKVFSHEFSFKQFKTE